MDQTADQLKSRLHTITGDLSEWRQKEHAAMERAKNALIDGDEDAAAAANIEMTDASSRIKSL